ncbi:GNAT family N-acetyltransferase [Streptomyces sp. Je 1-79]|uniref:GNAT family N-acetyltransferase n=1 Tax=Streptomyces sp. Je 1-79 TaxID=2943847 RepID=UPI0021A715FB|nr:GNAT family N-acetyltransferase [Streptomyces sp. Je 1-79]MCT4355016.1 GNAT family N-acetyltransferase [Streptomyces sp. Je 1-79]
MNDLAYRVAGPADQSALAALDDSFSTEHVYEVASGDLGFGLRLVAVEPPLVKAFPVEDGPDEDGHAADAHEIVAVDADGRPVGFISVGVEEWNRRLVVHQVTVDPAHRGRGIGGELMRRALAHGRERGARTAWLEVTSVNVPAVRAYRRMGFRLCGLDTTLYTGTESEGETALFMARPLDR